VLGSCYRYGGGGVFESRGRRAEVDASAGRRSRRSRLTTMCGRVLLVRRPHEKHHEASHGDVHLGPLLLERSVEPSSSSRCWLPAFVFILRLLPCLCDRKQQWQSSTTPYMFDRMFHRGNHSSLKIVVILCMAKQATKQTLMETGSVKMATGTYPMGTGHPYPHPPDQNLTRRVTHTRRRVENSFHTRTRWVILTRQYT